MLTSFGENAYVFSQNTSSFTLNTSSFYPKARLSDPKKVAILHFLPPVGKKKIGHPSD